MISDNNQVTENLIMELFQTCLAKVCYLARVIVHTNWSTEHNILTFWFSDQQNNDRIPNPVALMVPDVRTVTLLALLKLITVPCTRPETSMSSTRHICMPKATMDYK
jgi:hypothetical protein